MRLRATIVLLSSGLLGLGAVGCSDHCNAACEELSQCDQGIPNGAANCDVYCGDERAIAEQSGCQSEYDAWFDCLDDAQDACSSCGTQKIQYLQCQGVFPGG
jgi:hypothetical protein